MRALTSLNMSKNHIKGAEAGKALGDALAGNTVLKEMDLSGERYSPNMDIGFVKAFTPGLSDSEALLSLNISKNKLTQGEQDGIDDWGKPKYKTDLSGKPPISHHGI
jgi:hypothetical protein